MNFGQYQVMFGQFSLHFGIESKVLGNALGIKIPRKGRYGHNLNPTQW